MTIASWKKVSIKEAYQGLFDGPHATPQPADEGPVFLGIKNVTDDGRLDLTDIRHISEAEFPNWTKRVLPQEGDIVFTYEATLNRYAIIPKGFRGCLGRRMALIRPNPGKIDTRFLFQYFFSSDWRNTINKNILSGATVDRIPLTKFPDFEINLPPLQTQRKIASILSAYDDLIENNTRRIKILEEMARMVYREWFVNFRFPGHEKVKMVDSPLGMIPEGWEVRKLKEVAKVNADSIKKKSEPKSINYVDIASVTTGQIDKVELLAFNDAPGRARRIVKHGDVIWSMVRPNRKSYAMVLKPAKNMIVSTGFAVLSATSIPFTFLFHAVTTDDFVGYLTNNATGAAYPAVSGSDFENADMLVPPKNLLDAFHNATESIFLQRSNLQEKNQNLRQTRDLLLPKLISGEVGV